MPKGVAEMGRLFILGALIVSMLGIAGAAGYAPFEGAKNAAGLTVALAGQEVIVEGTITAVSPSQAPNQPTLLTISPESQKPPVIVAYMPDFAATLHGDAGVPKAGARVSAMGKLWDWKGMLLVRVRELNQVRIDSHAHTYMRGVAAAAPAAPVAAPATAAAIAAPTAAAPAPVVAPFVGAVPEPVAATPTPEATAAATPAPTATAPAALPVPDAAGYYRDEQIAQLPVLIGSDISYCGKVTAYRASWGPTAPNILTFGTAPNTLELVYWTTAESPAPEGVSTVGATVHASGLLQSYRGKMQLRISDLARLSTQPLDPTAVAVPAGARPAAP